MIDLTNVLVLVTMALSGWTLKTVHGVAVELAVLAERLDGHERRLERLEERSVP